MLVGGLGFSYEEAAEVIGCPVGTIKSRLGRGRERLEVLMAIVPPGPRDAGAGPAGDGRDVGPDAPRSARSGRDGGVPGTSAVRSELTAYD